jgi:hypothetical protein
MFGKSSIISGVKRFWQRFFSVIAPNDLSIFRRVIVDTSHYLAFHHYRCGE